MNNLGKKIKAIREEKRLSQDKLGKLAKLNGRHLSRIENNHITPNVDILKKIANELNVSIDYLVFDDVPRNRELNKFFDPELLEIVQAMSVLPAEKVGYIKEIIKDMLLANKASLFTKEIKRSYSKNNT